MDNNQIFLDYTEEGAQMWNNISHHELPPVSIKKSTPKVDYYEQELKNLRKSIKKMIINSQNVIKEAEEIISLYTDKQQYMTSEAKVYKTSHERLIVRLNKVLLGQEPFDFEIQIEEEQQIVEELSPLYYIPKR